MGLSQVFKSGSTEKATEVFGDSASASVDKRTGPMLDNRESTKFMSLDLSNVERDFNQSKNKATIHAFENFTKKEYDDDPNLMDSMINVALEKHKKRSKKNFIFDRIKAISSETKRINHNLDIGD